MKRFQLILLQLLFISLFISFDIRCQIIHYKDGFLYDSENEQLFSKRDFWTVEGIITFQEILTDSVVDLSDRFVIPAFGDYHTHAFDNQFFHLVDSSFTAAGILYAQDLVNDPVGRFENRFLERKKSTVDVKYANGCFTSNYGHPIEAYERMALGIGWPKNKAQRDSIRESRLFQDRTYYVVAKKSDIQPSFEQFIMTQPELVKVILWNSEDYLAETYPEENKGIDPAFLPEILKLAKQYNLEVIGHIENEYDLKMALNAGVHSFAHAPFYGWANTGNITEEFPSLSSESKRLLRSTSGVKVNPTLYRSLVNLNYLPENKKPSKQQYDLIKKFHVRLLLDLKECEVDIVAGADFPRLNAVDEIMYYYSLNIFSNAELLDILIKTSTFIFPNRKIGRLFEGYEANFLVLDKNPIKDFGAIKDIELTVKSM